VPGAAILDIDGTLVDTNYHHALAWWRALRQSDLTVPLWRVHRAIGMGGEKLVPSLVGEDLEAERGDDVRAAEAVLYRELMREVVPFSGARGLIEELAGREFAVMLSSSAKAFEVEHYLDLLGAREVADGWTTSADVDATKPDPELVSVALERSGATTGVMVGDSVFDCQAAAAAGIASVALLTGGFSADELRAAGAATVHASLEELVEQLDDTPFADLVTA
jgi:phosphoglycolate phosphatase-like HAD superfamily hydrolase